MQEETLDVKQKFKKALAQVVKRHRKEQQKSISKISAEIMMTKSMWTDLESGIKDPQLTTIWKISEALNIPLENIIKEIKDILGKDFTLID